jgi:acetyltransferase
MHNLLGGGFSGPVLPVNPNYNAVTGVLCYANIASLPLTPDLAVICTPPEIVPEIISELGDRGTKAAVIITDGSFKQTAPTGHYLKQAMLDAARPYNLRILGSHSLGLLIPKLGLNASLAHINALAGEIAFVSQSRAICTAVLDWAKFRRIGFSHFISLGDIADVNFADVLDYLGSDPGTRAILMYVEAIQSTRRFMSAARGAARNKPVLVLKAGRLAEAARAATTHAGAMAGVDAVYDAAIRRAGMLRVFDIKELFEAVETLARLRPFRGDRLAILSNGGGPGVMATDSLILGGGRLADLSEETIEKLNAVLPAAWSRGNPVDLSADVDCDRYAQALDILMQAPEIDAILAMHVPTAIASSEETAKAIVEAIRGKKCHVLTSWLGAESAMIARVHFIVAGIPTYDTPDEAVRAFLHLVRHRHNQEMLMETPPSIPTEFTPITATARRIVRQALAEGRKMLSEPESKTVLAAYGIPIVETRVAATVEDALRVAEEIGYPVALKIISPEITHKSNVGGVALNLDNPEALRLAAETMGSRVAELRPGVRIAGLAVQAMVRRPDAYELIVGVSTDLFFGPVILFGHGGRAVEALDDRAVGLPPLNATLADELLSRTRIARLLRENRDRATADLNAIRLTLIQISQLIVDIPEIVELDINPLLADERGVIALDARIAIEPATRSGPARLAIRPYPRELEEYVVLRSGRKLLIRPIRPEDEPAHYELFQHFSPEDIRFRFFRMVKPFPHSEMARFTQIDYDREMAFIATDADDQNHPETLGVVRAIADPDNQSAEFAIIVRSDLKRQGMGRALLEKTTRYCREKGVKELVGEILADNAAMLGLAKSLGFERHPTEDPDVVAVRLRLQED